MKKKMMIICLLALWFAGNAEAFDSEHIHINGFVSQGYLKSDKNDFYFSETEDGTFQYNEMGINFSTELSDNLRVGVQFLSRDLGELGNNKIEIDWAFGDYRFRNWLGLRAGIIKRPYGLYNLTRDVDAARIFVMLPIMVYDDSARDNYTSTIGIGTYGYLPYGLSYELQYGTVNMDEDGGIAKNAGYMLNAEITSLDVKEAFTAYLTWETPLDGLRIAGTMFQTPDWSAESSTGSLEFEGTNYIASVEYNYDNLTLAAEYRYYPIKVVKITSEGTSTLADKVADTWYVSASYRFTDWFSMGSYYGEHYSDKDDRDGENFVALGQPDYRAWRKDLALTTRFDINEYWIFKLEGHMMNGILQVNTPVDEADEDWFLFAAKLTFSF